MKRRLLITALIIFFPLLRAWLMNDFLFLLLFQLLNMEHSILFFSFSVSEHYSAQIIVPLIWLSFYLPFFVIFPQEKRFEALRKSIAPLLSSVIIALLIIALITISLFISSNIENPGWIFVFFACALITLLVFPVETLLFAIETFDYNFGKSLLISVFFFLVFPFLLVSGLQMILG